MYILISLGVILVLVMIGMGARFVISFNRLQQLKQSVAYSREDIVTSYTTLCMMSAGIAEGYARDHIYADDLQALADMAMESEADITPDHVLALQKAWSAFLEKVDHDRSEQEKIGTKPTNKTKFIDESGMSPIQHILNDISSQKRYLNAASKWYNTSLALFPGNLFRLIMKRAPLPIWPTLPGEEAWLPSDNLYLDSPL